MTSEPNPDLPGPEAKQLCLNCTAPNEPLAHFCARCGAPLSPHACIGPFESVFAEGYVYRSAAERPQKLIVVLGIWLVFGLMALGGILMMGLFRGAGVVSFICGGIGLGLAAISIAMLWKTTRNYLTRKKKETHNA